MRKVETLDDPRLYAGDIKLNLTTTDNPYDPFKDFKNWYCYDTIVKGYNTSERIAAQAVCDSRFIPNGDLNRMNKDIYRNLIRTGPISMKSNEQVEYIIVSDEDPD